jgi:hypothetical protein
MIAALAHSCGGRSCGSLCDVSFTSSVLIAVPTVVVVVGVVVVV